MKKSQPAVPTAGPSRADWSLQWSPQAGFYQAAARRSSVCLAVAGDTLLITQQTLPCTLWAWREFQLFITSLHQLPHSRRCVAHATNASVTSCRRLSQFVGQQGGRSQSCTWLSVGEWGWVGGSGWDFYPHCHAPTCMVAGASSKVPQVGFKELFKATHLSLDPSAVGRGHASSSSLHSSTAVNALWLVFDSQHVCMYVLYLGVGDDLCTSVVEAETWSADAANG